MDLMSRIMEDEGFRSKVYQCPAGYLTIGYGRNVDPTGGKGITQSEAIMLLSHDISECEDDVRDFYGPLLWDRFGLVRQNALINMRFQLGGAGFRKFELMHDAIRQQDWERASNEAVGSLWAKQTPQRARRIAHELRSGVSLY